MKTTCRQIFLAAALVGALAITPARFALAVPATNDTPTEAKSPNDLQNAGPADEDPWHFSLIPLGWLAGVGGNVTVHGHQANRDVRFDQAMGMFVYDFSRHFSFGLGYRALSVDKDRGSGSSLEGAHIILHGAILAFDFHW